MTNQIEVIELLEALKAARQRTLQRHREELEALRKQRMQIIRFCNHTKKDGSSAKVMCSPQCEFQFCPLCGVDWCN